MLSWDDFRIVKVVADRASLTEAAKALRINQSTVFRKLGQIEHRLGARLFKRNRTGTTLTPRGERVLIERGVAILPAILCNVGGVTVSYFEWKQNRQAESWDPEVVDAQLKKYMHASAKRVTVAAKKFNCDMRTAAYTSALEHIGKIYNIRGIFP